MKKLSLKHQFIIFMIMLSIALVISGSSDFKEAVETQKNWEMTR